MEMVDQKLGRNLVECLVPKTLEEYWCHSDMVVSLVWQQLHSHIAALVDEDKH